MTECCIICEDGFDTENPSVNVKEKGLRSLIRVSKEKELDDFSRKLESLLAEKSTVCVHHNCRRRFVDPRRKSQDTLEGEANPRKKLRSSLDGTGRFDWKTNCFLCCKPADKKHKNCVQVRTLPLVETLLEICESRGDEWGAKVHVRLSGCSDLVAEEAVYHNLCMNKFRLDRLSNAKKGRPESSDSASNFTRICDWIENESDSELYTLKEIHEKMVELSGDSSYYCIKYLKQKLLDHYGEHIYFAELPGRPNLLCFKDFSWYILENFKHNKDQSPNDIISAAANIIKNDIRAMECDKSVYPSIDTMGDIEYTKQWVPESLLLFLKHIIPSELKQVSIGQCISQASRPRSMIASIPFGVGVDIDKSFATKWLVDHLFKLGFSISSDEVKLFKESAVSSCVEKPQSEDIFTQWIGDNVDHNIRTLTGKGTFHGMGIISASSCVSKQTEAIERLKKCEFTGIKNTVEIYPFHGSSENGLSKLKFDDVGKLAGATFSRPTETLDLIWQAAWFLSTPDSLRPNWQGFMQHSTAGSSIGDRQKSSVNFLPIIDLNPSDETCIYSTLKFIINEANKLKIPVPCVTFDQPLWLKAMGIIKDQNLNIVCRLGGFHTLMSFLGSIGNLMEGSGLEELFGEVYAEHTVKHMMSGKAIARSLRAHIMTQSVLIAHLIETLDESKKIDVSGLNKLYLKAMDGKMKNEEIIELGKNQEVQDLKRELQQYTAKLAESSRTAKLWIQYIKYVDVIKEFICAERLCNWDLHLEATRKMLNLFAATGHVNYARSARLYLQEMSTLSTDHPYLHQQFQLGNHAIRRSERCWAGLWSDLVIEQTLMRSIKSRGGLTRGRGMEENVRNLWVSSISYTAAVHEAMNTLSGVKCASSEQHLEMGRSRMKQDFEDSIKFYQWFETRNPFSFKDQNLYSLSSGIVSFVGKDNINCENSEAIGESIQKSLDGIKFTDASIKRKLQVQPLAALNKILKIDDKTSIYIDSTRLFTRLTAVAQREEDEIERCFEYELTPYPASIFKNGLMRKPDKSSLRNLLLTAEKSNSTVDDSVYVLDGGSLLHRVHWVKGMKFAEVISNYSKYVRHNYGECFVVFDGYDDAFSIKGNEHERRMKSNTTSPEILIHEENEVPCSKERFLSNTTNKKQLISKLQRAFNEDGQHVYVCDGDADTKIVSTALEVSKESTTTVVADDTDVAIMLLYHWQPELHQIFFLQERGKKCWNIEECQIDIIDIREHLLFIHAWTGCDSTSAIFGKGKPKFLQALRTSKSLCLASETLSDYWATHGDVRSASLSVFKEMYGGSSNTTLYKLRYSKYLDMVCKGEIQPEKLPPTDQASQFHGYRVHLQIIEWKILDDNMRLDPTEWGWKRTDNALIPIPTDKAIAPPNVLKVIRCNCKNTSKNQCGTNRCLCRKNGIKCMAACGDCNGTECENQSINNEDNEFDMDVSNDNDNLDDDSERNVFDDLFK